MLVSYFAFVFSGLYDGFFLGVFTGHQTNHHASATRDGVLILFGCYNRPEFVHLQAVFPQRLNAVDPEEFPIPQKKKKEKTEGQNKQTVEHGNRQKKNRIVHSPPYLFILYFGLNGGNGIALFHIKCNGFAC